VPNEISDMVPSYKRIAIAILKNDYPLKSLGLNPPKSEVYNDLKKIELGISIYPLQLKFNFATK